MRMQKRKSVAAVCLAVCLAVFVAAVAAALLDKAIWPEASGENVLSSSELTVDYSHADIGYFMARGPRSDKGLKLRVSKGKSQLMYDLNRNGEWEVFPFQMGNGEYNVSLFTNVSGSKYASSGSVDLNVEVSNPNTVFLVTNQYVDYAPDTEAVLKSEELCEGLETDEEKFEAIRTYMRENYAYDFNKARTVTGGTLPSIDYLWTEGMGICQDLAATAACMLRVQGIPTQLVIGYVNGSYYHAWNSVLIDGQAILYDPTAELNAIPEDPSYTVERFY